MWANTKLQIIIQIALLKISNLFKILNLGKIFANGEINKIIKSKFIPHSQKSLYIFGSIKITIAKREI